MKQARTFPEIITLIGLRFKAFFLVFLLASDQLFFLRRKHERKYIQERIVLTHDGKIIRQFCLVVTGARFVRFSLL
jgi:ribosomal protein S3AE